MLDPNTVSSPRIYAKELARQKALSITTPYPGWILTADTIVVLNKKILGKPTCMDDAYAHLNALQNTSHDVITAFCLYHQSNQDLFVQSASAKITFNPIPKAAILAYIHDKRPFDKAGAYGIQECPTSFIHSVKGCKYTVMGLPIYELRRTIKRIQPELLSL